MKTIDAVLEHIYERVRDKINPSLTQITSLLAEIGNPQLTYPTYQVIGTNGKGTAARLLAALLEREGLRTGLYTSPHLVSARERIICDNTPITTEDFLTVWEELLPVAERWDATFFEVFTAMAFIHFKQRRVDAAVVEAGLGGTWDATSVTQPEAVLLTSVALDHTRRLGETREAIARDKAGAMKAGTPFICGERDPALREILRKEADKHGALFQLPEEFLQVEAEEQAPELTTLSVRFTGAPAPVTVKLPLCGGYQVDNFLTAAAAFASTQGRVPHSELIDLTRWPWPGRFDLVCREPLTIIDTAHNPDAARALFANIAARFPRHRPVVLYGTLADKDWRGFLRVIREHTDQLLPLAIPYKRALPAGEFAAGVAELFPNAPAPVAAAAAWRTAVSRYRPGQLLVACGSFHVAEAVYRQLNLEPFSRQPLEEACPTASG